MRPERSFEELFRPLNVIRFEEDERLSAAPRIGIHIFEVDPLFAELAEGGGERTGLVGHFDADQIPSRGGETRGFQGDLRLVVVCGDKAYDAEVAGVRDVEALDVDSRVGESFEKRVQSALPVFQKHGNLVYEHGFLLILYLAFVYDADGLAFREREAVRGDEGDLCAHAEISHHVVLYPAADGFHVLDLVREGVWSELHLYLHGVEVAHPVHDDLIMRADDLLDVHQYGFYLGGEDVDAADYKHIVRPAADALHPDESPAALALVMPQRADVAGAVADERHTLFVESGEHQLPGDPVGDGLQGDGVHYLGIEEVLHDVQSALIGTAHGHARTTDLRKPVDVVGGDVELALYLLFHVFGPGLRAEDADAQFEILDVVACLFYALAYDHGVGGSARERGRAEIFDEGDLAHCVACGSGDVAVAVAEADEKSKICGVDFCAEMLDAAKAKAAGKNLSGRIEFAEADCSSLPFADETFDGAAISFGFRNFKDRKKCLEEIFRVLKPGGKIAMLEVARANKFIAPAQKFFMWHLVPAIAKICGSDPRDYKYLAKTTLEYPSNPEVAGMFSESGFKNVAIKPQGFGLVAITHAVKPSPAGKSGK